MSTIASTQPETLVVIGKGGPNQRELLDGYLFAPEGYHVEFAIDTPGRRKPSQLISGRVIGLERETDEVNFRHTIGRHVIVKLIVHSSPAEYFFPGDIISNWYHPITRRSRITMFKKLF